MVRWIWTNRLVNALFRPIRLLLRWLWIWLNHYLRKTARALEVTRRFMLFVLRPRDPNNVFMSGIEASQNIAEVSTIQAQSHDSVQGSTLLWSAQAQTAVVEGPLNTSALSLWRGAQQVSADDAEDGAQGTNRRFAYLDVLAAQLKRIVPSQIKELERLVQRLARRWLDMDERFDEQPKRNRLDIGQTLRYNIPRYAGYVLNLKWATKQRPIPQLMKPARILVIGDVSHSMVHYVSVILHFFHMLNFRFVVESYVFSENATHSTPYLNGLGTFEDKVGRLVTGAKSWNAGTRFGSSLEEIARTAFVDEFTYVIIATDGKVSLRGDETSKIEHYMSELKRRAKQVIFLTPSTEFSDGAQGKAKVMKLGSLKYDFLSIPIYAMGPPIWYGILSKYAHRLYLVRTVQDLVDMSEDLILSSRN